MTTASQLIGAACALMLEPAGPDDYLTALSLPLLNLLLAENLTLENGLRQAGGLPPLEAAPMVTAPDDPIDYRAALCRVALPYGLAGLLYAEQDPSAAVAYKNKYEYERAQLLRGQLEPVLDCYGG